jgi:hypothetical protein
MYVRYDFFPGEFSALRIRFNVDNDLLFSAETEHRRDHGPANLSTGAWRDWTFSKKLKRQQYEKQRQIRTHASVRVSHDSTNPSSG